MSYCSTFLCIENSILMFKILSASNFKDNCNYRSSTPLSLCVLDYQHCNTTGLIFGTPD